MPAAAGSCAAATPTDLVDRRTFLRTALVAGAAGVTGCTDAVDDPVTVPPAPSPSAAASPSPSTSPAAAPGTATPAPGPTSRTPSPDASAVAAPSPSATPAAARQRLVISRDLLELPPPAPGGQQHTIDGLMLHHTATATTTEDEAPGRFRAHTRSHRDAGFVDIAYHWGVDTGGNVYQLRDEAIAGETFTGYDPAGWLLVVCEGNFEESEPPLPMLEAVADVLAARAGALGVDPATLIGHRELTVTSCPGDRLQSRLGELTTMVQQRLAADPVVLAVTDDPAVLP